MLLLVTVGVTVATWTVLLVWPPTVTLAITLPAVKPETLTVNWFAVGAGEAATVPVAPSVNVTVSLVFVVLKP